MIPFKLRDWLCYSVNDVRGNSFHVYARPSQYVSIHKQHNVRHQNKISNNVSSPAARNSTGNQILTTASSRNSPDEKQASIFSSESTGIIETEINRIQKAILGSNTQRIDRHQMPINYTNWFYVVELRVSRNSVWKSIYNSCFFVVCDIRNVLICWLATIYN